MFRPTQRRNCGVSSQGTIREESRCRWSGTAKRKRMPPRVKTVARRRRTCVTDGDRAHRKFPMRRRSRAIRSANAGTVCDCLGMFLPARRAGSQMRFRTRRLRLVLAKRGNHGGGGWTDRFRNAGRSTRILRCGARSCSNPQCSRARRRYGPYDNRTKKHIVPGIEVHRRHRPLSAMIGGQARLRRAVRHDGTVSSRFLSTL